MAPDFFIGERPDRPVIRFTTPLPTLIRHHGSATTFLFRVPGFVGEHPLFHQCGTFPSLPPHFLDACTFSLGPLLLQAFDLIEQKVSREDSILSLLPRALAFYTDSSRLVVQHNAGGRLVDVLTARSSGMNEGLLEIAFANAERSHSPFELRQFVRRATDGVHASAYG